LKGIAAVTDDKDRGSLPRHTGNAPAVQLSSGAHPAKVSAATREMSAAVAGCTERYRGATPNPLSVRRATRSSGVQRTSVLCLRPTLLVSSSPRSNHEEIKSSKLRLTIVHRGNTSSPHWRMCLMPENRCSIRSLPFSRAVCYQLSVQIEWKCFKCS
jgi:hypothetical protein